MITTLISDELFHDRVCIMLSLYHINGKYLQRLIRELYGVIRRSV